MRFRLQRGSPWQNVGCGGAISPADASGWWGVARRLPKNPSGRGAVPDLDAHGGGQGPAWGEKTGRSPTDGGKLGVKRWLSCAAAGIPLAVAADGGNVPDVELLERTPEALATPRPDAERTGWPGMCLDPGGDAKWVCGHLVNLWHVPHLRSRGAEKRQLQQSSGVKTRRGVVG